MIPQEYVVMYLGAIAVALVILWLALWRARWALWTWVAIYAWAAFVNTRTAGQEPYVYLVYGALTPSDAYRAFIEGWFSSHIRLMVFSIAAGQLAIALLLSGSRRARRLGEIGAIVFLLAIAPLGVGSGFPFSLIAAASILLMERRLSALADDHTSRAAPFIPRPDARELNHIVIHAPAEVAFKAAAHSDAQALPLVRALFWLRGRLLGDTPVTRTRRGLVCEMLSLGWGVLVSESDRTLVMGAIAKPWERDVQFEPVPPDGFAAFDEPGLVKIVWTLEAEQLGPALTHFWTETRVEATDDGARRRFRWYWRGVRRGVQLIRWQMLRGIKRDAERRFRDGEAAAHVA